ncbi:MAG: 4a-hydroxytetrahydrobiopterin dehydratase [Bdellovibrionota bacterium]
MKIVIDRIKNSSRELAVNVNEELTKLNSKCRNIEWKLGKREQGNYIHAIFHFQNSDIALKAVHLLNEMQKAANHHTTFTLENFSSLKIELCTHQPKYGVTEVDLAFAEIFTGSVLSL